MFKKLFKKDNSIEENKIENLETTSTQQIQDQPTDESYLEEEHDRVQTYEVPDNDSDEVISEPIQDDDFNAEFDLPDVGMVDDIDEDALRAELEQSIKDELMSEDNIEAVNQLADDFEQAIGITEAEWESTYNNPELLGYEDRKQQALVFGNVLPEEFDVYNDTVLDVGCGVGDLWAYCNEVLECDEPYYSGIDSNTTMIDLAKEKFKDYKSLFTVDNIDTHTSDTKYDWVVAMSAFNMKVKDVDMNKYIKTVINKMYDLSNKGIAINLMHSFPEGEDWSDEFHLYNSSEIFKWVIDNFYNVKTHRNYIDRDFILYIYK